MCSVSSRQPVRSHAGRLLIACVHHHWLWRQQVLDFADLVFQIVYTIEMAIKLLAFGLWRGQNAYLRQVRRRVCLQACSAWLRTAANVACIRVCV